MLQYRSVYPQTLELLKQLMQVPELNNFFLVGGTALALQIGHRISVDLDLFTLEKFHADHLLSYLKKQFTIVSAATASNTLNVFIQTASQPDNTIKVDLIRYPYSLPQPPPQIDGIRILALEDLIPMKLAAITNRGSKKDFYDIFFLLKEYKLPVMLNMFSKKFPETNLFQVIKSLTYFEDAEMEPDPITFEPCNWEDVKTRMIEVIKQYQK